MDACLKQRDEIVWKNNYLVSINEIDVQYKRLCQKIIRCILKANSYPSEININDILVE